MSPEATLGPATGGLLGIMAKHLTLRGHQGPRGPVPAGRHYPPDALNVTGHARSRRMIAAAPTYLALAENLGTGYRHVLYRVVQNVRGGNCYDPRILQGVRAALREALQIGARRGHMAMVGIETGSGQRPLHVHVLCALDVPLPKTLHAMHGGRPVARFTRKWEEARAGEDALAADIQYLLKSGHEGGQKFRADRPAHHPEQPPEFRQALKALLRGRRLARDLGLTRLPPRSFVVWQKRLTAAQRAAAVKRLESELTRLSDPRAVSRITAEEWKEVKGLFARVHGAGTVKALSKLRHGLNVVLRAAAEGVSLGAARRKEGQVPRLSTIYKYAEKFTEILREAQDQIATLRAERSPLKKFITRLGKNFRNRKKRKKPF